MDEKELRHELMNGTILLLDVSSGQYSYYAERRQKRRCCFFAAVVPHGGDGHVRFVATF